MLLQYSILYIEQYIEKERTMLIQHFFMGAMVRVSAPPGGTVLIFNPDENEVLRKVLELLVDLNEEAEGPVGEIWEELNREESQN